MKQYKNKPSKSIILYLCLLSILSFTSVLSLCCVSPNLAVNIANYPKTVLPLKSAIQIKIKTSLKICLKNTDITKPKTCLEFDTNSAGSGSIIQNTKNGSLALTADHVCNHTLNLPDGIDIEKQIVEYKVFDFLGKEYNMKVVSYNKEDDICIIYIDKLYAPIVPLSNKAPELGDRIYNLGFPRGIYAPKMVLIYEGFYSGIYDEKDNIATYSIFAIGGSSGSMLLNRYGELIGMIHSGFNGMEHMSFSPTYDILKNFIKNSLNNIKI